MATFGFNEADNYGSSGGGSFFSLKDDKDTAKVRFLYSTIDDVRGYAVHRVQVGDKERYVNCLRAYNEPLDKCPFCAAQIKVQPRMFIKLYNEDSGECQIWDRSKSYFQKLASLANHYNPLCDEIVEIERNGKKGDQKTEYMFYPLSNSKVNIEDYDVVEPLGTIILDKSAEDMDTYLATGSFPDNGNNGGGNSSNNNETPWDNRDSGVQRRTPQNTPPRRAF